MLTVRSMVGPMLLAIIWRTVFEPIGAEKLDMRALARHHADLMLHALAIEKPAPHEAAAEARDRRGHAARSHGDGAAGTGCSRSLVVARLRRRARYLGYVEGETSLIAPPIAGRLVERPVDRGDQVKKGDRLFVIDPVLAEAEVARAEAALAEAGARYENLLTGKRQEEQDVVRAQRRETEARWRWPRSSSSARAELRQGRRHAQGLRAGRLPGRASCGAGRLARRPGARRRARRAPDEIAAAKALVDQRPGEPRSGEEAARRSDAGRARGRVVENTFFNVGEWVPAGTPVVSLLPPSG